MSQENVFIWGSQDAASKATIVICWLCWPGFPGQLHSSLCLIFGGGIIFLSYDRSQDWVALLPPSLTTTGPCSLTPCAEHNNQWESTLISDTREAERYCPEEEVGGVKAWPGLPWCPCQPSCTPPSSQPERASISAEQQVKIRLLPASLASFLIVQWRKTHIHWAP